MALATRSVLYSRRVTSETMETIVKSRSVAYACLHTLDASFCRERNNHIVVRATLTEQRLEFCTFQVTFLRYS